MHSHGPYQSDVLHGFGAKDTCGDGASSQAGLDGGYIRNASTRFVRAAGCSELFLGPAEHKTLPRMTGGGCKGFAAQLLHSGGDLQ